MPGKRLVQFEKVPHTLEIQGRIGEQLKAQYDVVDPIPHRLAELLKRLAQLELLKELTQLNAKHQAVFSLSFQGLVAAGMPSCKPKNRTACANKNEYRGRVLRGSDRSAHSRLGPKPLLRAGSTKASE